MTNRRSLGFILLAIVFAYAWAFPMLWLQVQITEHIVMPVFNIEDFWHAFMYYIAWSISAGFMLHMILKHD